MMAVQGQSVCHEYMVKNIYIFDLAKLKQRKTKALESLANARVCDTQ